jgi:hypothetical protein
MIAYDLKYAWGLKNFHPLPIVDAHKEVSGEKRKGKLYALTVLPDPKGFVSGKKGLYLPQIELLQNGLFVLRSSENGVPLAIDRGVCQSQMNPCRER